MSNPDDQPFIIVSAICDASARPAAITVGHGDAMERAYTAADDRPVSGIDLVELPVSPAAFTAMRGPLQIPASRVTVYDLFPLSSKLKPEFRSIAGQFLAAEALWTLEEQGLLQGVPFSVQFDVPAGWDRDPKKLHERLVAEHALDLSPAAIDTFKAIKQSWEQSAPA